jgi:hypothetical protein
VQHLADPVAALREMRRVCVPNGLVAVRDADYAAMTWHPPTAALTRWLALYHEVARAGGGEPDAGRRLLGWAHAAGFRDVDSSASAWCFARPADIAWWSETWAGGLVTLISGIRLSSEGCQIRWNWLNWQQDGGARESIETPGSPYSMARYCAVADRLARQGMIRSPDDLQVS